MLDCLWYQSDVEKLKWYQTEKILLKLLLYKNDKTSFPRFYEKKQFTIGTMSESELKRV